MKFEHQFSLYILTADTEERIMAYMTPASQPDFRCWCWAYSLVRLGFGLAPCGPTNIITVSILLKEVHFDDNYFAISTKINNRTPW